VRVAQREEAQVVLVDEVEVEEAVDVADGGVIADGVSLVGIGEAAEDVPGRGDGQEEQRAGEEAQLAPATPLAGEDQVGNGGADEEDGRDQALGEQWPGPRRRKPSRCGWAGRARGR
jgi:hypothetical protein